MGGGYYDREVEESAPGQSSQAAQAALTRSATDPATQPKERSFNSDAVTPIVVCMDITGSMNDYPKIIYDKLPMFYGQIMIQNYVKDPALSFAFYAHATSDQYPLQVSDFARGNDIDDWLRKMYFYSCGGGDEGLEYPAFLYGHRCTFPNIGEGGKGFYFIIGDSLPSFDTIRPDLAKSILGVDIEVAMPMEKVFEKLKSKYHVFFVCRIPTTHGLENGDIPSSMKQKWIKWVGKDHILLLPEAKAVVDIMLGALCLTVGTRTWETYLKDLQSRGQSDDRIKTVYAAVHNLEKK